MIDWHSALLAAGHSTRWQICLPLNDERIDLIVVHCTATNPSWYADKSAEDVVKGNSAVARRRTQVVRYRIFAHHPQGRCRCLGAPNRTQRRPHSRLQ